MYPKSILNVIEAFKYLPGIGDKTAERMALYLLNLDKVQTDFMADAIKNLKDNTKRCKVCGNFTSDDICFVCNDPTREKNILCVVEDPKTVIAIEKLGVYHGMYHVLNGLIKTLDGLDPADIRLDKLIERINNSDFKEIIIAVKPCLEGEMTSLYINNVLKDLNISITRLASGIPMGADMEYVDAITLEKAFDNRKKIS
ncbi:MAG: recombination mediator RecR [Erysipelotrichaceae bacterium]|nr:recombination mediator RecR [Erysipelotrichaceae bacterium]